MEENTILIASYGTLRKGYGNSRLINNGSNFIGTGKTVEKYTLTASGIPFVSKNPLSNIVVDLWKVNVADELPRVDALESHPTWYKREEVDINLNGTITKAWLYFNEERGDTLIKSGDYADYRKPNL